MSELSERPEKIDEDLKLVLLYTILIKEKEHLVPTIRELRKIHRCKRLYESYMDLPCRDLLENPNKLVNELKKFFLIKKVYKYEEMNDKIWEKFTKEVDKKMDIYRKSEIVNIEQLDKAWNRIINAIQESSIKVIPRSKIGCKKFYAFSKQTTKLHIVLKETNKLVRMLKKKEDLFLKVLNKTIDKINKLAEVHIDKLEQIDIQDAQREST
ncbi:42704_t:CDS:2, partial [Gigaspora margarita]